MDGIGLKWVVEWRVQVRSRLEGVREIVLVQFARSARGANSAARQVLDEAIDAEVRVGIESPDRAQRRPAVIANEASVLAWDPDREAMPARFWASKWAQKDRDDNIRILVGMDFDEAVRRCVHARLLDDNGAFALLASIEAALDAHAASLPRIF